MNIPFIILLVIVVALTISIFVLMENHEWSFPCFLMGLFTSLVLIVASFVSPLGASITKTLSKGEFRLEETPYRVIVQADGKEWVWTDAFTVASVAKEKPVAVKVIYSVNAWGIVFESMEIPSTKPKAIMLSAKDMASEQQNQIK